MDDNNSISVSEALNQLQSWLNAGEYDKVVQGCTEILQIEPGNQRALALMKMAEERRHSVADAIQHPHHPVAPKTVEPSRDPLAHLQVENAPSRFEHNSSEPYQREEVPGEKRQFFLAMLIPAVLVVLIGGGLIWYVADQAHDDLLADNTQNNVIETPAPDTSYLKENDQRIEDMTQIKAAIDAYKAAHGSYPSLTQIESALTQNGFTSVPVDPRQGQVDKAGKAFGYVYASYSVFGKANQAYVLSALFEDSKGFGYAWTSGAPSKNYPDYRTVDEVSATFLGDKK